MKRRKNVLSVVAICLAALSLVGCSNSSSSNKSDNNKPKSNQKVKKTNTQKTSFRKSFDKIQVGDVMQQGNGGSTLKDVKNILGQPNSISATEIKGFKVKSYSWTKYGTTIMVQFSHKKAITKTVSGFKWTRHSTKLKLKAFNSIKTGSSYKALVNSYGEPDGLNENVVLGKKNVTAVYFTGIKAKSAGANASFTFADDKLVSKTETNLK